MSLSRTNRIPFLFCILALLCFSFSSQHCSKGECTYDEDCAGNRFCRDKQCVGNVAGDTCKLNSDCKTNEVCQNGACIQAECEEGAQQPCYDGPLGTSGVGICKEGTKTCTKGRWGWCEGQRLPATEVCNQLDDDCNGQNDDSANCSAGSCTDGQTRPCYSGPPGTQDVGICRVGTETCTGGKWGGCIGDTRPNAQDICNDNLDNNCNGQVDENCGACNDGQTRPCYEGPPNTRNVGACKEGTQTCNGGAWAACNGEVKPATETCGDNVDNDCNGQIDELPSCQQGCTDGQTRPCYTGAAGTKDVGVCKAGGQSCQNGKWGNCLGEIIPSGEQCNDSKDNNCNGQTDENCGVCNPGEQEVCYTGASGCTKNGGSYQCNPPCQSGTRTCLASRQWGACTGEKKPALSDQCGDNVDNNCNGQIDENCSTKLHAACTANSDCDSGQICLQSEPNKSFCYQDCTSNRTVCQNNTDGRISCTEVTNDGQGNAIHICVKSVGVGQSCDLSKSILCGQGMLCDSGTCKQVNVAKEGEVCDINGTPPTFCENGTTCVNFGTNYDTVCLKLCPAGTCSQSGFSCTPLSNGSGVCIQGCQNSSDCNYSNHQCIQGTSGNICIPTPKPGNVKYAGVCDTQNSCSAGLICVAGASGATSGVCATNCTTNPSCPSSPSGGACVDIGNNQKGCIIRCTSSCPTGLRCQSIGGSNYCFP